jgi:hypothetical protein
MPARFFEKLKLEATLWLGRRLPTCAELTQIMSESLERRLTLRERVTLRLHFLICKYCVWYLGQLRLMRGAARSRGARIPDEASPQTSLSPEARERIRSALTRGQQ